MRGVLHQSGDPNDPVAHFANLTKKGQRIQSHFHCKPSSDAFSMDSVGKLIIQRLNADYQGSTWCFWFENDQSVQLRRVFSHTGSTTVVPGHKKSNYRATFQVHSEGKSPSSERFNFPDLTATDLWYLHHRHGILL